MKSCILVMTAVAVLCAGAAYAAPPAALISGGAGGLVVSSVPAADAIGQAVLDSGGNAVDAAVATGYALAVCHPAAGNIGGGGFAVIHTADGHNYALDFRETAPGAAKFDMFLDRNGNVTGSTDTYKAVCVPGTVAGMSAMLERFGTRPQAELMAPAIKMAEEGCPVTEVTATRSKLLASRFNAAARRYFLRPDGTPHEAGEMLVQNDLAATLRRIAEDGNDGFYSGTTAELIEADMAANGGLITRHDLSMYSAKWREPVTFSYRGHTIITMSPPSGGGVALAQILSVMQHADIPSMGHLTPRSVHIAAEAMRRAFADRSMYLGDPDYVSVPADELLSAEYILSMYRSVEPDAATPSANIRPGLSRLTEGDSTTHYSVIDADGNAVSVTFTLNSAFGLCAAVEGAGFLLNNEMDDFSAKPGAPNIYGLTGGDANSIKPYKRPLSSMCPTIVLKDGRVRMILGSPGGSHIITAAAQVISNVIDHGMAINDAVSAPRLHMQWLPDELRTEHGSGLAPSDVDALVRMGYRITMNSFMGGVNAIAADGDGAVTGARDTRGNL